VVILQLAPTFLYRWEHGVNPQGILRQPSDVETYALKIVQLLLPVADHRFHLPARLKASYNAHFTVNENQSASIGLVGSVGFLLLIGWLLYRRRSRQGRRLEDSLSVLNVFAVLLATMGGLGSLFSLAIGPHIRGYNRVSVYIAFYSIFAVLWSLEKLQRRLPPSRVLGLLRHAVPIMLVALGILDQTNRAQVPPYEWNKNEYQNDAQFVKRIETSLPAHAMVFELPYSPFPEGPHCIHQMFVYDEARPYLHSKTLRWSYGAFRGREADLWQQSLVALPPQNLLEAIAKKGFEGLYIDRNAYPDHGASLEAQLVNLLDRQPLVSANGRMAFFDLRPYTEGKFSSNYR
jgi:phosphoglycerol transferase